MFLPIICTLALRLGLSHPLFSNEHRLGIQTDPQPNFPSSSGRNRPYNSAAVFPIAIICIPSPRNQYISFSISFAPSHDPCRPPNMGTRSLATARRAFLVPKKAGAARTIPNYARRRALCTTCRTLGAPQQRNTAGSSSDLRQASLNRPTARIIFPATFTAGSRRKASVSSAAVDGKEATQGPWVHLTNSRTVETPPYGPLQEYDRRVNLGLLRNDEHQRGM